MIRRLYDWAVRMARHPAALPILAVISFLESSIFPIPPDVMMIPMIIANRERAFTIAAVATVSSVIGGFAGYAVGYWVFEAAGKPILDFYGYADKYAAFQAAFNEYGWWIIILKGMTPIPYKLITIASGAAHFPLWAFAIASVISRAMRFYLLAVLLWWFGEPIRYFIEKHLPVLTWIFLIVLIGGFILVRYVV